jgi:exosortase/archaeosortase family protein
VVKACAGGNFLLASWLGWLWRWRAQPSALRLALHALAAAWLTTLLANAVRIVLIAYAQDDLTRLAGLTDADSHRLIGIGVFFGALLLQLRQSGPVWVAPAIYLGVTLLVPLLHAWSSGHQGIDAVHAGWSIAVTMGPLMLFRWIPLVFTGSLKPVSETSTAPATGGPLTFEYAPVWACISVNEPPRPPRQS